MSAREREGLIASSTRTSASPSSRDRALRATVVALVALAAAVVALAGIRDARARLMFRSNRQHAKRPFWRGAKGQRDGLLPRYSSSELTKTRTFTLYDHCLPEEVLEFGNDRDFWTSAPESAKVVQHNHESHRFFEYDDGRAVKLLREEISDGLYAWRATGASHYDWEFGFAFENKAGKTFYEIGKGSKNFPLAFTSCSQRYGDYFNRNVRNEQDGGNVSYVFGTCDRECDPGYVDTTYKTQNLTGVLTLSGPDLDLGPQRDARLITPLTIMMWSDSDDGDVGMDPHQRVALQIDTTFAPTKDRVRWIAGAIDYHRDYLKMVRLDFYLNSGNAFLTISGETRHSLAAGQGYDFAVTSSHHDWRVGETTHGAFHAYTDPSRYDLTAIYYKPSNTAMTGYKVQGLQYKSLKIGVSAPVGYEVPGIDGENGNDFLPDHPNGGVMIAGPGAWGPDEDVRRVIVKSGVMCSQEHNGGACMYAIAQPFSPPSSGTWNGATYGSGAASYTTEAYSGPTKTRKQWVFGALVGFGWKLVRIEVFKKSNGSLWMKAVDAGADHTVIASSLDQTTGDPLTFDLSASLRNPTNGPYPPYKRWGDTCGSTNCGQVHRSLNMGGIYYDLAGSMVPSLTGIDPIYPPVS